MPLTKLIYHKNARYIMQIQIKLQSTTFAYNGGLQNEMHHILGILRSEFTILLLFWICFLTCIGLDYYTTNNIFNDIVINNLTKLLNIKCACFFIQDYTFQIKPSYYYCFLNSTTKNNTITSNFQQQEQVPSTSKFSK